MALVPVSEGANMPTMQLQGHEAEVFCTKFSPCGKYLASAGADRKVFLWDIAQGGSNVATSQ